MRDLVVKRLPEQAEVDRRRALLASLNERLAEVELEHATLTAKLEAFRITYLRRVGGLLAELDAVAAEIYALLAASDPVNPDAMARAEEARQRAEESAREHEQAELEETAEPFQPSEDLKRLYRRAAKLLHPDLASAPEEQRRRTEAMVRLNDAYRAGDADRIEALVAEFAAGRTDTADGDPSGELERIARQTDFVRRRIAEVERDLAELGASQLADLHRRVEDARARGVELLDQMRREVLADLQQAHRRLDGLRRDGASGVR